MYCLIFWSLIYGFGILCAIVAAILIPALVIREWIRYALRNSELGD